MFDTGKLPSDCNRCMNMFLFIRIMNDSLAFYTLISKFRFVKHDFTVGFNQPFDFLKSQMTLKKKKLNLNGYHYIPKHNIKLFY